MAEKCRNRIPLVCKGFELAITRKKLLDKAVVQGSVRTGQLC